MEARASAHASSTAPWPLHEHHMTAHHCALRAPEGQIRHQRVCHTHAFPPFLLASPHADDTERLAAATQGRSPHAN